MQVQLGIRVSQSDACIILVACSAREDKHTVAAGRRCLEFLPAKPQLHLVKDTIAQKQAQICHA